MSAVLIACASSKTTASGGAVSHSRSLGEVVLPDEPTAALGVVQTEQVAAAERSAARRAELGTA